MIRRVDARSRQARSRSIAWVAGALLALLVLAGPSPADAASCVSRRHFTVTLQAPEGERIATAMVVVRGRAEAFARRARVTVDLRGLPRGRYAVRFVVRTDAGRTLRSTRYYRTCADGS
jgi:hypothetical protein